MCVRPFCYQDPSLTCGLERCGPAPVRNTQIFTAAWMQWRRCIFQRVWDFVPLVLSASLLNVRFLWVRARNIFRHADSDLTNLRLTLPVWINSIIPTNKQIIYSRLMILYFISRVIIVLFTSVCSVVLQKVEDAVEKLEVELAALLDAIEAPEWRPLLDNTGKTAVDILEDPSIKKAHQL